MLKTSLNCTRKTLKVWKKSQEKDTLQESLSSKFSTKKIWKQIFNMPNSSLFQCLTLPKPVGDVGYFSPSDSSSPSNSKRRAIEKVKHPSMFFNINQLSRIHVVYSWFFFNYPFCLTLLSIFWSTLSAKFCWVNAPLRLACETFQVDSADSNPCCGTAGAMSWCGCGMPDRDPVEKNRGQRVEFPIRKEM